MEALEFRPDDRGAFDELVARFADGGVFIETMSDQGVYVDFSWNDGRHCQLWITVAGRSKLRYSHEDSMGDPPRFDSWGKLLTRPTADLGEDGELLRKLRRTSVETVFDDLENSGRRETRSLLVNPDGREAADRIEQLREALELIAEGKGGKADCIRRFAKAALSRSGG